MKKILIALFFLFYMSSCEVEDCWYFQYGFIVIENRTDDIYELNISSGNYHKDLKPGETKEYSHIPIGDIKIEYWVKDSVDEEREEEYYINKCDIYTLIIEE